MTVHAFTVDLEEWFHGIELPRSRWPTTSRVQVGLSRLLPLLERHRVKATFFVLGVIAERQPNVVTEIANAGHEIACHGYAHEFVYRQSVEEFRDDIRRARDVIGEAAEGAPRGYRAPYFSIRKDSLWALQILAEEGFEYDCSVFPVYNDRYGIPDAPTRPYGAGTLERPLREVPLTPLRVLGLNIPFAGGAYMRILPWSVQRILWSKAARSGTRIVAYTHPWELDPSHPRIPLRRRVALTHYARLKVTEDRLDRLFSRYQFGSVSDLLAAS